MKILVTGSNGQLGQELQYLAKNYNYEFIFTNRSNFDILNVEQLATLNEIKPDILINCAAYTAVDKAETETNLAMQINATALYALSKICTENNIHLVHISTDFVFNGNSATPYKENLATHLNVCHYGKTKKLGEDVLAKNTNKTIIRTSWLYSSFGNNFVNTIIKLSSERNNLNIVYSQVGSPTYARDLAKVICDNLEQLPNTNNIYHYCNSGVASWYDFAIAIKEFAILDCNIEPALEYKTPAIRPKYSVLSTEKIKEDWNLTIPYWRNSLKQLFIDMEGTK